VDGPAHAQLFGRLGRRLEERLDGVPSLHHVAVGCHDLCVLRVEVGHGCGVALVEQLLEPPGEAVDFLSVKAGQGHW
jgi:hypothetical protein